MRLHHALAALATILFLAGPAHAQTASTELTAQELRARVYELLTWQCGVEETRDRFRVAIAELGSAVEPILLSVLVEGAPPPVREAAQARAAARYERRQAWLEENGKALFGADAERLQGTDRAQYVAGALRRLDALFRENAVRGLGVVGGARAASAVEVAVARDPELARLGSMAIEEIRKRR